MAAKKKSKKEAPRKKFDARHPRQSKNKGDQALSIKQRLIKAMSHPLRAKILAYMNECEWSPNGLSEELGEPLSNVSYHVKVLRDFELIELTREEPRRGAVEHFYRAVERTLVKLDMAKSMPKTGRGILINDALGEIDEDVNESAAAGAFNSRDDIQVVRIPGLLDELAFERAHEVGDEFIDIFLGLVGESACRLAKSGNPKPIPATAVLLIFPSPKTGREASSPKKKSKGKD